MHVLILHGIQGRAGENWGQWLHDELVTKSYEVLMPSLPDADHPDRTTWLKVVTELVAAVPTEQLVIVAHSLGVTTALDYVEQLPGQLKGLISVSGMAEAYGLELNDYFLKEKLIDFNTIAPKLDHAAVFYGDDDPYVTQETLLALANDLRVTPTVIHEGGHLNVTAGFTTFPQLLAAVTNID